MKLCYEGINLRGFADDMQEVAYQSIYVTPQQIAEIEKDYHNWFINPNALQPYKKPQCDSKYIKFENDVFVEMTPEEKQAVDYQEFLSRKQSMLAGLQQQTYNYIASKMPDWRLNRWKSYYQLSQRVANNEQLSSLEQAEYNGFLDPGETHTEASQYVPVGLQWVLDCIEYHKELYMDIAQASNQQELNIIQINYPVYPLEF